MYGNEGYGQRRSYAPVKVGDELNVSIEAVGEKGDGIAKQEGFVLFVPNTKEGDNVKVRVTRVLRKVGFAEVCGEGQAISEAPAQVQEPAVEDSENFGEDLEAGDKPAEESSEEALEDDVSQESEEPVQEAQ